MTITYTHRQGEREAAPVQAAGGSRGTLGKESGINDFGRQPREPSV